MREDTKKELLTSKAIRKDLMDIYIGGIWSGIRYEIIMLICYLAVLSWFNIFLIENTLMLNIVFIVLFFVGCVYIVSFLYNIVLVIKGKYTIKTDVLIGLEDKDNIHYALLYRAYRLHFCTNGVFKISGGKNYKWSEKHCMTDDDIFNYANVGDSFYLVTMNNKKKILVVYNKKLFYINGES